MPSFIVDTAVLVLVKYGMLSMPLVALLIGIVIGWWIAVKESNWPYGVVAGLVCTASVALFLEAVADTLPEQPDDSSSFTAQEAERIEERVRGWLDQPTWQITRRPQDENLYFAFDLRVAELDVVIILDKLSKQIEVRAGVVSGSVFAGNGESEKETIREEIRLELLRMLVEYLIQPGQVQPNLVQPDRVTIRRGVMYTDELTLYDFVDQVMVVVNSAKIALHYYAGGSI